MRGTQRTIRLECVREHEETPASRRAAEVRLRFGLPSFAARGALAEPIRILEPVSIHVGPGRIVAFVGPSGSGKSSALNAVETILPGGCAVDRIGFPADRPVVDAVASHAGLADALGTLSACGLSEAPLWLRRFDALSEGERFRARLARALDLHSRGQSPAPLLCDEFCSNLHRRSAKAVAWNLRKLVTRRGLCVVVAFSNEDLLPDLQPDTLVRLLGRGRHETVEGHPRRRQVSLFPGLRIGPGVKADFESFADMHYRGVGRLGFVDKVFVLREGRGGAALGVVVYAFAPLGLALRNRATEGRFRNRPDRLNREVRILRRLVIHPDVRGCGLGHWLVRQTLPQVGTRYVECLASMGSVNPVFERAGMTPVGVCPLPTHVQRALRSLADLDVDALARDFVTQVCRRPQVRAVVARTVLRWYEATTGCGRRRAAGQSPACLARTFQALIGSRPVYYLWDREEAAA
jgi:energy-coupling factor transporter ATP-binding protein EcfA2/GNAT superfamily N-acetyltransferase